jgi:hypothetical protein
MVDVLEDAHAVVLEHHAVQLRVGLHWIGHQVTSTSSMRRRYSASYGGAPHRGRRRMSRIRTWCVLASAAAAVLATQAVPAEAAPAVIGVSAATSQTVELAAIRRRAIITFDKNHDNPSNSTLTWKVVHQGDNGVWRVVEELSWRAGSGKLGRAGRNECAKGRGWLPNGRYRLRFHRDYQGNLIKGRAFRLDDKRCRNGTWRVQLFIHTEQGAGNTQCPNLAGDQVCRWEFPQINDYKSAGCIKLAPEDLAELSQHFLHFYKAGVRYSKKRVVVRVVT